MYSWSDNILYVGGLHPEGTSWSRFVAISRRAKCVDSFEIRPSHTIVNKVLSRLQIGIGNKPEVSLLEKMSSKAFDIIWIDKPTNISLETLKIARKVCTNTIFVAHITDDIKTMIKYSPHILEALKCFDIIFTCSRFNINEYPR